MSMTLTSFLRGGLDHRSAIRLGVRFQEKLYLIENPHPHLSSHCLKLHRTVQRSSSSLDSGNNFGQQPIDLWVQGDRKGFQRQFRSKTVEEDTKDPAPDWSVFFVWLRVWRSGRGRKQSQVILRRCLRMNRRTWRCYGAVMNVCFLGSCSKSSRGKGSLLYLLDFEPARNLLCNPSRHDWITTQQSSCLSIPSDSLPKRVRLTEDTHTDRVIHENALREKPCALGSMQHIAKDASVYLSVSW